MESAERDRHAAADFFYCLLAGKPTRFLLGIGRVPLALPLGAGLESAGAAGELAELRATHSSAARVEPISEVYKAAGLAL